MSLRSVLPPLFGLIVGLALGLTLASTWQREAPVENASSQAATAAANRAPTGRSYEIEELRAKLTNERARRYELEEKIAELESRLAENRSRLGPPPSPTLASLDPSYREGDPNSLPNALSHVAEDTSERFHTGLLERLGYPPREIERIQENWDAYTMAKLNAVDEAKRGLGKGPNFVELRKALREDLGDDGYDAMLYATGQSNRVRVGRVLDSSPAAAAGLREGDIILRYDGVRVFKPMLLRDLARQHPRGDSIELRIRREDGLLERLFIESGAMGASTVAATEAPRARP